MGQVKGCHLIGSVPFTSTEDVFRKVTAGMPGRLRRIPDGETGERNYFIVFQRSFFEPAAEMMPDLKMNSQLASHDFTPEQVEEGIAKIKASAQQTHYDDFAIASYQDFKRLRDEGVVPKDTKFQVSIPTHTNTILAFTHTAFQPDIEPIYKAALFKAMRNIQDTIPHEDLSIQLDLACEYMFLENISMFRPWFHKEDGEMEQRKRYIYDYIIEYLAQIDQDVEVGLHNCYGDMQHKHFKEPDSLAVVAELSTYVFEHTPHPINFYQCPVPPSANDKLDAYYKPFKALLPKLKEHGTELYLGVVREDDLDGTKARVEAAKSAFPDMDFGVATECGLGRVSAEKAESVMQIVCEVAEPVS